VDWTAALKSYDNQRELDNNILALTQEIK